MTTTPKQYLLLIFRQWGETYWLINRPGLPISPDSPLIHNTPSDPILIPDLLASLTESLTSDRTVYTGYQFVNTWTTDESTTDHFILLERSHPTNKAQHQHQHQHQTQTQNQDQGEAEAEAENNASKDIPLNHNHRTMPGSISWVSRDMSRINEHLSQALEICGSDLCALLAQE
ncbi:uncharacterized protein CDV56_101332 [Aspergillus thermomutatus]|uniref:Uncharacterized protein n=1 Tax=Aspergillus thermomutatus TaxID=41047 RepID=A0A397GAF7_ASPTH|nr:uncharacterized protein CDV56_101332 [Aspergillus thermomutatus]RHZ46376.1 hypothetical protein CDV56_101332 [Aspergillus thermomutatus]